MIELLSEVLHPATFEVGVTLITRQRSAVRIMVVREGAKVVVADEYSTQSWTYNAIPGLQIGASGTPTRSNSI